MQSQYGEIELYRHLLRCKSMVYCLLSQHHLRSSLINIFERSNGLQISKWQTINKYLNIWSMKYCTCLNRWVKVLVVPLLAWPFFCQQTEVYGYILLWSEVELFLELQNDQTIFVQHFQHWSLDDLIACTTDLTPTHTSTLWW